MQRNTGSGNKLARQKRKKGNFEKNQDGGDSANRDSSTTVQPLQLYGEGIFMKSSRWKERSDKRPVLDLKRGEGEEVDLPFKVLSLKDTSRPLLHDTYTLRESNMEGQSKQRGLDRSLSFKRSPKLTILASPL